MMTLPSYVLITPARNEAQFIELTIKSVAAQTVRPLKWVIVSDGSTDGTDNIVSKYAAGHPWIELIRMPDRAERNFAGKVHAFNAGYAKVVDLQYEVIGNLDADVSFDSEYFEFLLGKLAENPRLGVAGTPFTQGSFQYDYRFTSIEHVSGPCQLFRRECFEEIGGYAPRELGGIDLVAVLSARARGWQTRTFTEKALVHHRGMNAAQHIVGLREKLHRGRADYLLGSHPVWEMFRSLYQMRNKPYLIGGLLILAAYFWDFIRGVKRTIPEELIALRQAEQMRRLNDVLRRRFHLDDAHN